MIQAIYEGYASGCLIYFGMIYDKIQYIVALISEFARHYNLNDVQAARYMSRYGALYLCDSEYEVMHIQSFNDMVKAVAEYCKHNGGLL